MKGVVEKEVVLKKSKTATENEGDSKMHSTTRHQESRTTDPLFEKRKPTSKTRITIKFDVGFGNALFIRGTGANLSWDKGIMLRNTKPDEWVWETASSFAACEFKVLINDKEFELGDNHPLTQGAAIQFTPKFNAIL